jgi:Mlc titration factor MtfA (ptsG expression regulator)
MSRRKHLPDGWEQIVERRVAYWQVLDVAERQRLAKLADFVVADKRWEAARGFEMTDEVVVTIAVQAAVLILGLDASYFGKVTSIIVHPTTFSIPGPRPSSIRGMVDDGVHPLLGEAHHDRGPVLLAWDQVRSNARHRGRSRNVVLHEFAHKMDMLDGVVDGTPLLPDQTALDRWIAVCAAELELMRRGEAGPLLDDYGAIDPGEFFAVATETFFGRPVEFREAKPQLYEVLADYYRQDPAAREPQPVVSDPELI